MSSSSLDNCRIISCPIILVDDVELIENYLLSTIGDELRPGIVHRIDKDTSGLLVVAKTETAMAHLSAQFKAKTSEREYVALVWGNMDLDEGTIEGNIGRHPKNRLQNTLTQNKRWNQLSKKR